LVSRWDAALGAEEEELSTVEHPNPEVSEERNKEKFGKVPTNLEKEKRLKQGNRFFYKHIETVNILGLRAARDLFELVIAGEDDKGFCCLQKGDRVAFEGQDFLILALWKTQTTFGFWAYSSQKVFELITLAKASIIEESNKTIAPQPLWKNGDLKHLLWQNQTKKHPKNARNQPLRKKLPHPRK
jgi:hypothetical protein